MIYSILIFWKVEWGSQRVSNQKPLSSIPKVCCAKANLHNPQGENFDNDRLLWPLRDLYSEHPVYYKITAHYEVFTAAFINSLPTSIHIIK